MGLCPRRSEFRMGSNSQSSKGQESELGLAVPVDRADMVLVTQVSKTLLG